jgi:hypothetical protein
VQSCFVKSSSFRICILSAVSPGSLAESGKPASFLPVQQNGSHNPNWIVAAVPLRFFATFKEHAQEDCGVKHPAERGQCLPFSSLAARSGGL